MEMTMTRQREQAHTLLDVLPEEKLVAVYSLLEVLVDPVSRSLANAPYDDEPVREEEARDIIESRAACARGEIVSNDEVLAEFGLTAREFDRMGQTPLEPEPRRS